MDKNIQKLIDIEEIRNLRVLYSHYLDGNNIQLLDQIFSEEAVVEVTVGKMEGITEIKAGLADAFRLYDRDNTGSYPFMHVISNHWVNITGEDTAEGKCYLIDLETASKPSPNPLLLLGVYKDEYQRIDGTWKITRTVLDVVWENKE